MTNSWVLARARLARSPRKAERLDLVIQAGKIAAFRPRRGTAQGSECLDLRGCMILPGLINSHDHLEFNLFPRLGSGPYPNAGAWARDIYHPGRSPVREHLRLPLATRLHWGAVKNLLSGVTTVCHHNAYVARVFTRDFPVRVPRRYGWAHSLEFGANLQERFRRTPGEGPFVLHLGEAVDRRGKQEIFQLEALGALDNRTVLVHGVALGRRGWRLVKQRGASLIWCPSSNIFILGRTLKRDVLETGVPVALGTDSALSGQGGLLEELAVARRACRVPISRLYRMVTCDAAKIMRLRSGEGELALGGRADLLVVRDKGRSPAATLLGLCTGEIELVMVGGEVKLASASMFGRLPVAIRRALHPVTIEGRKMQRVFLAIEVPKLYREVETVLGSVILAGKRILRFP